MGKLYRDRKYSTGRRAEFTSFANTPFGYRRKPVPIKYLKPQSQHGEVIIVKPAERMKNA